MNSWSLTGNIGNDADQRFIESGESIVNFSVAVKSGYGAKAKTIWARCSMFGKRGESVLPYLKKGQLVGVYGELSVDEYTDKSGTKCFSINVRVNDLTLLGRNYGDNAIAHQEREPEQKYQSNLNNDMEDDDIPF